MDYLKQMGEIERLIAGGFPGHAVQTAGSTLEMLYKDLYRKLLGHMPRTERDKLNRTEERKGGGKGLDQFTLGQLVGLFREANLVTKLEQYLNLSLPFMKSFDPNYVLGLRNEATHKNAKVEVEDAQLIYWQLKKILTETGRLDPMGMAVERIREPVAPNSTPPFTVSTEQWATYADSLSKSLKKEETKFRVPIDILANYVQEYNPGQSPTDESQRRSWLEVAGKSDDRLTLLIGDPGEGKTVSFAALASTLLEAFGRDSRFALPIRVRLAFYDPQRASLTDLVAEQFRTHLAEPIASDNLPALLSQHEFVFLFDGLNEVPNHIPLIREFNALMWTSKHRFFLSCRTADYTQVQDLLPGHQAWQLQRFTHEEIEEFLNQYLPEDVREKRLGGWLSDEHLVEVLGTPFFLSLFTQVDPANQPSPRNRAELCHLFVDSMQARELRTRPELQTIGDLWTMLDEIAFRMQELHETHLSLADFEQIAQRVWMNQLYGQETTTSLDAKLQALYTSPILVREFGKVTFTHQIFRDFFAARCLRNRINLTDPTSLLTYISDTWWDYTIVLVAGLLPDASPVLHAIVYEGGRNELAWRCLAEAKQFSFQAVQEIVEWMRQGGHVGRLHQIGPAIAALPEGLAAWVVAETEAIVRTALAEDSPFGTYFFAIWQIFSKAGWPISEDMLITAAEDKLRGTNSIARRNSLSVLASQGRWGPVLNTVSDMDSCVRRTLAEAIGSHFEQGTAQKALPEVLRVLSKDTEAEVRAAAIKAAHVLPEAEAVDLLEAGLSDPNARVQLTALQTLVDMEGGLADELRSRAIGLLEKDFYITFFGFPEAPPEDLVDILFEALEKINTPESCDGLYEIFIIGYANGSYVAQLLANRNDPRALRVLIEMMLFDPEEYFEDVEWLDSIEDRLVAFLGHPLKLAWFEALLIDADMLQKLEVTGMEGPRLERIMNLSAQSALSEMVDAGSTNRSALLFFLLALNGACNSWCYRDESGNPLLLAAIGSLLQLDPLALADYLEGDENRREWFFSFRCFVSEAAERAGAFVAALPEELKKRLFENR